MDWSKYEGQNLLDKVMFYSEYFEKWFSKADGWRTYMLMMRDYLDHPLYDPDPENLTRLEVKDGFFTLWDNVGRTRVFSASKMKFQLAINTAL